MKSDLPWFSYLREIILFDNTRPVRLMMALVNLCFASYLYLQQDSDTNLALQFASIDWDHSPEIWVAAFLVNAYFLLKGLDGRYNFTTLMFEGLLGAGIWIWVAITHWAMQGGPGPTFACALCMIFICVRYPTHWTSVGGRDGY